MNNYVLTSVALEDKMEISGWSAAPAVFISRLTVVPFCSSPRSSAGVCTCRMTYCRFTVLSIRVNQGRRKRFESVGADWRRREDQGAAEGWSVWRGHPFPTEDGSGGGFACPQKYSFLNFYLTLFRCTVAHFLNYGFMMKKAHIWLKALKLKS